PWLYHSGGRGLGGAWPSPPSDEWPRRWSARRPLRDLAMDHLKIRVRQRPLFDTRQQRLLLDRLLAVLGQADRVDDDTQLTGPIQLARRRPCLLRIRDDFARDEQRGQFSVLAHPELQGREVVFDLEFFPAARQEEVRGRFALPLLEHRRDQLRLVTGRRRNPQGDVEHVVVGSDLGQDFGFRGQACSALTRLHPIGGNALDNRALAPRLGNAFERSGIGGPPPPGRGACAGWP